ncbi:MAG: hypothetical protein COC24_010335 [Alphaproteobacteria bacterium]|nr:hypothetical protein [Alphaproteobacteria bacterium]
MPDTNQKKIANSIFNQKSFSKDIQPTITINCENPIIFNGDMTFSDSDNSQTLEQVIQNHLSGKN